MKAISSWEALSLQFKYQKNKDNTISKNGVPIKMSWSPRVQKYMKSKKGRMKNLRRSVIKSFMLGKTRESLRDQMRSLSSLSIMSIC